MTIAGASAALAGAGCWSPRPASREKLYPYVRQPEQMTLGLPLFFATGFTLNGITTGVLGKSREGRPIELLLFLNGRQRAARVALDGPPVAVAALHAASLGP